jgi:hypothetical protein
VTGRGLLSTPRKLTRYGRTKAEFDREEHVHGSVLHA